MTLLALLFAALKNGVKVNIVFCLQGFHVVSGIAAL
jgi:hypothetical protein